MKKSLDEEGVRELLRAAVSKAGGPQAWANQAQVSIQYVSDVLHHRRQPGPGIYEALGLKRLVSYVYEDA